MCCCNPVCIPRIWRTRKPVSQHRPAGNRYVLDKPNLWSIKRGKETEPYCESAVDSNHYPDYEYGYAVVSLLKGESDYGKMTIAP